MSIRLLHGGRRRVRAASPTIAALATSLLLGACASGGGSPLELASAKPPRPTPEQVAANPNIELQKATEYWGKQLGERPTDPRAAVNYARNLKALGSKKEALVILQEAHRHNPTDREINAEYGRLALEHDQISAAQRLLEAADDTTKPDWRVISARGTVLAKQGRHDEAIPFFQRALALAPNQASVMNNLAMAHAMNGEADKAETMLRNAAAKNPNDTRISHNLSLVLGLQGKHDEAGRIASAALPADAAAHNADVMRQMVGAPAPDAAPPAAPVAAAKSTDAPIAQSKAAQIPTASTSRTAAKGKAKPAADEPAVDASELVRRLADGHAAAPPAKPN